MSGAWSPESWQSLPITGVPVYSDSASLSIVGTTLSSMPSLVFPEETNILRTRFAAAARGEAFLLLAGDSLESFAEFHPENIRNTFRVVLQASCVLTFGLHRPVVKVCRFAGQFSRATISPVEVRDGIG